MSYHFQPNGHNKHFMQLSLYELQNKTRLDFKCKKQKQVWQHPKKWNSEMEGKTNIKNL